MKSLKYFRLLSVSTCCVVNEIKYNCMTGHSIDLSTYLLKSSVPVVFVIYTAREAHSGHFVVKAHSGHFVVIDQSLLMNTLFAAYSRYEWRIIENKSSKPSLIVFVRFPRRLMTSNRINNLQILLKTIKM